MKHIIAITLIPALLLSSSFADIKAQPTLNLIPSNIIRNIISIDEYINQNELNLDVYALAKKAQSCAIQKGVKLKKNILTIVDFSLPSYKKRLWVVDTNTDKVLYNIYVAHGRDSGLVYAKEFSNADGSYKSSLGTYLTGSHYYGHHGLSVHLNGLEKNFNSNVKDRYIVVHGASYVSKQIIQEEHRIGRSEGCFAITSLSKKEIMPVIENGTVIFAYYPDKNYLKNSEYLNCTDN